MPRLIRAIEIYLPLEYNDGNPIETSKFVALQDHLLDRFEGITSTQRQFPLQGIWQSGSRVYYDQIVVFSALDFSEAKEFETIQYLERLKTRLKKRFSQLEILITMQTLLAI